jgi:hypothetical protein
MADCPSVVILSAFMKGGMYLKRPVSAFLISLTRVYHIVPLSQVTYWDSEIYSYMQTIFL